MEVAQARGDECANMLPEKEQRQMYGDAVHFMWQVAKMDITFTLEEVCRKVRSCASTCCTGPFFSRSAPLTSCTHT